MFFSAQKAVKRNNWKFCFIGICVFSFLMGVRYGVGVDYFAYYADYLDALNGYSFTKGYEICYSLVLQVLAFFRMPIPVFFGTLAFLQMLFLTNAMKTDKEIMPYMYFVFIAGAFFLSYANIMRQAISISLWIWSIRYIVKKQPIYHYLILLIALGFHSSSLILFVAYPIFSQKDDWFRSIPAQYAFLLVSLVLMRLNVVDFFVNRLGYLTRYLGYGWYLENGSEYQLNDEVKFGLGFLVTLIQNILIIGFSNKTRQFFKSPFYNISYSLFFFGIVVKYVFINSMLIARFVNYFYFFTIVVGGYTLYYLFYNSKKYFYFLSMIMMLILFAYIFKGESTYDSYIFFWQNKYYPIKNLLLMNR